MEQSTMKWFKKPKTETVRVLGHSNIVEVKVQEIDGNRYIHTGIWRLLKDDGTAVAVNQLLEPISYSNHEVVLIKWWKND